MICNLKIVRNSKAYELTNEEMREAHRRQELRYCICEAKRYLCEYLSRGELDDMDAYILDEENNEAFEQEYGVTLSSLFDEDLDESNLSLLDLLDCYDQCWSTGISEYETWQAAIKMFLTQLKERRGKV